MQFLLWFTKFENTKPVSLVIYIILRSDDLFVWQSQPWAKTGNLQKHSVRRR
jgi:hypothetical protein